MVDEYEGGVGGAEALRDGDRSGLALVRVAVAGHGAADASGERMKEGRAEGSAMEVVRRVREGGLRELSELSGTGRDGE